jgi:putative hydroxymethylpyrimidine transport system substrate-binding protein
MPARLELRRRGVPCAAAVIATALCAAGCGEVHARLTLGAPRPLTVALDGPPGALYASLYAAQSDGAFRDGALAVTIAPAPGGDSLAALESGRAQLAVTSEPALLAARGAGQKLVAIGALVRAPLAAIVSLSRRPVTSARQLAGRRVAIAATPLAQAELATALATAHVPAGRVRTVSTGAGGVPAALTRRRGAVGAALDEQWPIDVVTLERGRRRPTVLALTQAGVPPYSGLVLAVRVSEARSDGPLLRAFLQSLSRGARAVAADPAATAATLARVSPGAGVAVERAVLAQLAAIAASATAVQPFGFQDARSWHAFGVWMGAHGLLRGGGDAAAALTNEFLPGQGA